MKIQSTRLLAKIVIAFIGIVVLLVSIFEILGTTLFFTFDVDGSFTKEIPYHRLQSLRITIFLTFSYYSLRYLLYENVQQYPIQFLDVILKIYILISLLIFATNDVELSEYSVIVFFFFVALIAHIASRPKLRRYYYSKFTNTKN